MPFNWFIWMNCIWMLSYCLVASACNLACSPLSASFSSLVCSRLTLNSLSLHSTLSRFSLSSLISRLSDSNRLLYALSSSPSTSPDLIFCLIMCHFNWKKKLIRFLPFCSVSVPTEMTRVSSFALRLLSRLSIMSRLAMYFVFTSSISVCSPLMAACFLDNSAYKSSYSDSSCKYSFCSCSWSFNRFLYDWFSWSCESISLLKLSSFSFDFNSFEWAAALIDWSYKNITS